MWPKITFHDITITRPSNSPPQKPLPQKRKQNTTVLTKQKHSSFKGSSSSSSSMAITSISSYKGVLNSPFYGCWGKSIGGEDCATLAKSVPMLVRVKRPIRSQPMMKNVNEGKGLFAPIVVVTRNVVGKKTFNQLRGKAIALHSQVINEFCKSIGADAKQRQGLIRLAKKNGEKLGFLA